MMGDTAPRQLEGEVLWHISTSSDLGVNLSFVPPLVPHPERNIRSSCLTAKMTVQILPNLVFDTEIAEASTPVVLVPGRNNITLTRHHLQQASQQLADSILSKGQTNGSGVGINGQPVVALALPNGIGFVCTFLGLVSHGAVAAPLNPAYTVPEYEVSTACVD